MHTRSPLLGFLARQVRRPGHTDSTIYGSCPLSTRSFFLHHLSSIAAAVINGDANILANEAAFLDFTHSTSRAVAT